MFTPSHWTPLHDYVLIALAAGEEAKSEGGVLLPESAKEETVVALVEEVGPGLLRDDGTRREMHVKRGATVIVNEDAECLDLGDGYHLVREHHVALVRKEGR